MLNAPPLTLAMAKGAGVGARRGTPRKGAMRSITLPATGAETMPPVRRPPCGSSIRISTK